MGEKFYHLSPQESPTLSAETPRTTKQSKRGAKMVGLYSYPKEVAFGPEADAIRKQYGQNVFEVELRSGAKVVSWPGEFTRITPEKAQKLRDQGIDAVRFSGPATMGRTEVIVLNDSAIKGTRHLPSDEFPRVVGGVTKKAARELVEEGAKAAAKRGGKAVLGPVGVAADYLTPTELGDATLGGEFESAEQYHRRKGGEDPEWLSQQPGYEKGRSGKVMAAEKPPWAEEGWYRTDRFGERDLSPEGVREAREAAAKKATEGEV